MKAPNKGNHPCPILLSDGGDYINGCRFNTEISDCSSKKGEGPEIVCYYPTEVQLFCPPLEALIDQGLAKIVLCLEQRTIRRFVDYYDGIQLEVKPYELRLSWDLEITPIIVSTGKTKLSFDPKYMDPIYDLFSKNQFSIEPGQILAYGATRIIKTNQVKGLSQIIVFRELTSPDSVHPFTLDLSGDKIVASTNKEITRNIEILQSSSMKLGGLVNAALTYPIFYMVIYSMLVNSEEYSEKKWFVAIKNKINDYRRGRGLPEEEFAEGLSLKGEQLKDLVWELTSQLLTDGNGQLMLTAFKDAGSFAEN